MSKFEEEVKASYENRNERAIASREEFEKAANEYGYDITPRYFGDDYRYETEETDHAFDMWQASQSSLISKLREPDEELRAAMIPEFYKACTLSSREKQVECFLKAIADHLDT